MEHKATDSTCNTLPQPGSQNQLHTPLHMYTGCKEQRRKPSHKDNFPPVSVHKAKTCSSTNTFLPSLQQGGSTITHCSMRATQLTLTCYLQWLNCKGHRFCDISQLQMKAFVTCLHLFVKESNELVQCPHTKWEKMVHPRRALTKQASTQHPLQKEVHTN